MGSRCVHGPSQWLTAAWHHISTKQRGGSLGSSAYADRLRETRRQEEGRVVQRWEYCDVSPGATSTDTSYRLCMSEGVEHVWVNACSHAKEPNCVVAYLGSQGWEAFGVVSDGPFLWFKRPRQG